MPVTKLRQALLDAHECFISIKFNGEDNLPFEGRHRTSILSRVDKVLKSLSNNDFLVFEMPDSNYRFFIGKVFHDISYDKLESFLQNIVKFDIKDFALLPAIRHR